MPLTVVAKPSILGNSTGSAIALGAITGPTSYAAGGFAVDVLSDFNVPNDYSNVAILVFAEGGYMADYDPTNKKIKVYATNTTTGLPAEVPNATDLSQITFFVLGVYA